MEKLSYRLESFEGPLDLLLQLIAKNKMNILDIRIGDLLDQYMEQIEAMREQEMEVASEFLEMAARLVHLKTVSLLPKHEEAESLRQELTGQLLEYQECKRAAEMLAQRMNFGTFIREPTELPVDRKYKRTHDPREILAAYLSAAGKGKRFLPPAPEAFSGIVSHKVVSVSSQIVYVLRRLWRDRKMEYRFLFEEKREKSDLVATFLAVLELVKGKRIRIEPEDGVEFVRLVDVENRHGEVRHWKSKNFKGQ